MPIPTTPEKLQQTADEVGDEPVVQAIPYVYIEGIKLKLRAVNLKMTNSEGSNSLILGHPINGIIGTATGLGGGQIVLGASGTSVTIDLIKRSYEWNTRKDFERGTIINLDTSQGYLQLGNVTLKDILLEHKTK